MLKLEYNLVEIFIDLDDLDISGMLSSKELLIFLPTIEAIPIVVVSQTIEDPDIFDKLCILCVGSKTIRVVRQNKSMTTTSNKLEEMHTDLWGLHEPPL